MMGELASKVETRSKVTDETRDEKGKETIGPKSLSLCKWEREDKRKTRMHNSIPLGPGWAGSHGEL